MSLHNSSTPAPSSSLAWPFLSSTFPLLLASQLASSPATVASADEPPGTHSKLIQNALQPVRGKRLTQQGEKRVRSTYIELIIRSGRLLELPNLTISTACVYWHRFFSLHSLLVYHPSLCAAASLFLASKAEESSRRVRDVINVVYRVEHMPPGSWHAPANTAAGGNSMQGVNNGAMSPARTPGHTADEPLQVSQLFWDLKEEVLRFEQKLLRVLAYEMKIYHPQVYVLHFARELECSEEVCRSAYYICNDSQRTTLCLQYGPNAIACACIYLAAELMSEQIRFHPAIIKDSSLPAPLSVASGSPYRSPHPSAAGGGAAGALGGTGGQSGLSGSSGGGGGGLLSTSHASEWWEYFGRVNQLEMEDITHQLLDVLEEISEEEEDARWQMGRMTPNSAGNAGPASIHVQLQRIAEEEDRAFQRSAVGQMPSGRAGEQDAMDDVAGVQATPAKSQIGGSQTNSGGRRPAPILSGGATTPHAPSSAAAAAPTYSAMDCTSTASGSMSSASKPPHRLQLGAYAPQLPTSVSSASSQARSFPGMPSSAASGGPSASASGYSATMASYASTMPSYSSASGVSMMPSMSLGPSTAPSYSASYSPYAPPSIAQPVGPAGNAALPPSITIAGPR
jgi:hypothetical protein